MTGYTSQLQDANIPIVINKPDFFTYIDREQSEQPNWPRIFEGQDPEPGANRDQSVSDESVDQAYNSDHLCLTCSEIESIQAQVSFDIDSFLGFAQDLAFARQGLDINLFPRFHTNIQTNLHLYTTVLYDFGKGEKQVRVKLQKVPHYCAGRVLGHEGITFYVFFPRMYEPDKATNFPGKGDGEPYNLLRTWTDSILIPAIFRHIPATSRQHFPHSWEHARQKAQAYHAERSTKTRHNKLEDQVLSLHYSLHPQSLAAIWQDIQEQLLDP